MTKTQRVLAAIAVAAGTAALAAPTADAAVVPADRGARGPSLLNQVEDLSAIAVAPEYRSQVPRITQQFGGLSGVQRLGELRQLVTPVAPLLGLVPGVH
ncbi:hypothetical protein [Streptomyces sp. NPDC047886]|uniref:hypothetical protein n=1 Tax=Streptomyces sp. NPDC047886 TaxID=3365490 RepID=UPI003721E641